MNSVDLDALPPIDQQGKKQYYSRVKREAFPPVPEQERQDKYCYPDKEKRKRVSNQDSSVIAGPDRQCHVQSYGNEKTARKSCRDLSKTLPA